LDGQINLPAKTNNERDKPQDMNTNRDKIVPERYPRNSRKHNLALDERSILPVVGMLLAILALWPISLGQVREYIFLTLAALLVIRSTKWIDVEEDESAMNAVVEVRWLAPPGFVLF
jgi:hypothetical protein